MLNQSMDKAYIRSRWRKRDEARSDSWSKLIESEKLKTEFKKASTPQPPRNFHEDEGLKQAYYRALAAQINEQSQGNE
jgi:hypothetical protein